MKDELEKGMIYKSASVETQSVDESELRKINKHTLVPVTDEEVFTFKVMAGDNELDDRSYEPFNLQALKDLARLYPGKTVIKDHRRTADNQVARIYDAELSATDGKASGAGEPLTSLMLKCYMIKTDSNKDLIAEINAGIKKEVSTGFRAKKVICSICGTDNSKTYCPHYPGREYDKEDGKHVCYFTLDGVKDAYELSLVAVPAQPRAGATKSYTGETVEEKQAAEQPEEKPVNEALTLSVENVGAFLFAKKSKLKLEEKIHE